MSLSAEIIIEFLLIDHSHSNITYNSDAKTSK